MSTETRLETTMDIPPVGTTDVLDLPIKNWRGPFSQSIREYAAVTLEAGKVIVLEELPFILDPSETKFLDPVLSGHFHKNITFDHRRPDLKKPKKQ